MAFVSDTFTGAADTELSAHTGEIGATWAKLTGYTDDLVLTDANRVRESTGSGTSGRYYASGVPPTTEYDVDFDIFVASNPETEACDCFALARVDTGTGTAYAGGYSGSGGAGTGKWFLHDGTEIGSFAQTLTVSQTYHCKMAIRDADKKVYIDGVQRITSVTNAITIAGRAGIALYSGSGPSNTTGLHLDNFVVTDIYRSVIFPRVLRRRRGLPIPFLR